MMCVFISKNGVCHICKQPQYCSVLATRLMFLRSKDFNTFNNTERAAAARMIHFFDWLEAIIFWRKQSVPLNHPQWSRSGSWYCNVQQERIFPSLASDVAIESGKKSKASITPSNNVVPVNAKPTSLKIVKHFCVFYTLICNFLYCNLLYIRVGCCFIRQFQGK